MVFNSFAFLFFGIIVFALWPFFRTNNHRRWLFISVSSCFFYGWWDWRFVPLFILTAVIDYFMALLIEARPARKKIWLAVAIGLNLSVLSIFKYAPFLLDNATILAGVFGVELKVSAPGYLLPIGISFYTLQSLGYVIDVYRGFPAVKNFLHFFSFLSFFPQLVAGPIERSKRLIPQLATYRIPNAEERWTGLILIAQGLFKKTFIADNLAYAVDQAYYGSVLRNDPILWWIIGLMFAFQLYADFSGYTDIARGVARWLGIELMENFRNPFSCIGGRSWWARYHISLTTWFRDYLYALLKGNSRKTWYIYLCLWLTTIASGLWHGPAWKFVCWAMLLAFYYQLEYSFGWPGNLSKNPWTKPIATAVIWIYAILATPFFRSPDMTKALAVYQAMFRFNHSDGYKRIPSESYVALFAVIFWELLNYLEEHYEIDLRPKKPLAVTCTVIFWLVCSALFHGKDLTFAYYNF